jgi:hypothetical protein
MRKITTLGLLVSMMALQACSVFSGDKHMVNIVTTNGPTATCLVMNENSKAVVNMTPGGVLMTNATQPTQVACTAPGGWHGNATGLPVSSPKFTPQDTTIIVPMSRN